jgi:hypothetical protein
MRSKKLARFARANVKEIGDRVKSFSPKSGRKMSLEKQGTNTVVKSAEDSFGTTILLRGVGTREMQANAVSGEESTGGIVVELSSIVSLKTQNWALKLGGNISMKCRQSGNTSDLRPNGKVHT